MKILQTANVMTPEAGGVATTLHGLAVGYRAAGQSVTQLVLGDRDDRVVDGQHARRSLDGR